MLAIQIQPHAHMPFLFQRDHYLQVAYCQSVPRYRRRRHKVVHARPSAWKLQWSIPQLGATGPIVTGLGEREDECSPTVCDVDGGIQLSFIGTLPAEKSTRSTIDGASHRLFVMRGRTIDQLRSATRYSDDECYCGFARPDLAIIGNGVTGSARIVGHHFKSLKTTFKGISRISYCYDAPSQILVTGLGDRSPMATIVVDLDAGRLLGELKVDGQSSYKPTLLAGRVMAPQMLPGGAWQLLSRTRDPLHPTPIRVVLQ